MKYANMEIDFTTERLVEIASLAINALRVNDDSLAMGYFREVMELTDYEREFFGIPTEDEDDDYFEDCISNEEEQWSYEDRNYEKVYHDDDDYFDGSAAWEDDSDRGCKDCPPDECTGHCMSCYYRPV